MSKAQIKNLNDRLYTAAERVGFSNHLSQMQIGVSCTKTIDLAKKTGFAFTCTLACAFAASSAVTEDRYADALNLLESGGHEQLASELRHMMRRAGV